MLVAVAASACDDSSDDGWDYVYGNGRSFCGQYTTCVTCTPVSGCGWCFEGAGTGRCVDGPDECAGQSFGWTWEPRGCGIPADAGVSDARPDAEVPEASVPDSWIAPDSSEADVSTDDAAVEASTPN